MNHEKATDYTVVLHMNDGTKQEAGEWFSLGVARKIAAKAYDARVSVVNSNVQAIEIIDINDNRIQFVQF